MENIIDTYALERVINDRILMNNITNINQDIENTEFIDLCNVMINNNMYTAIDDVYKSISKNYYMRVYIHNNFIDININKIDSVFNKNNPSQIANKFIAIKNNIIRLSKIDNIVK